ncbi:MAG: M20/M25/M40 family metallo-hydrolase [Anaerolineae bacterium]|nr:M20/M25/M40 family metallo-hydrolase [Anaerolineae bacterium]
MKSETHLKPVLFFLWLALITLACNLTGSEVPPTVSPRATPTPPPTIGYETLSPEELPEQVSTSVANASVNAALINLANEIETDRLMLHVDTLQNFGTRHVNSGYSRSDWGIGAAAAYVTAQFEKIRADSQGRLVVFPYPFELEWGGVTSQPYNIVAFLSGTEEGAGTILIGAHYDSISIAFEDGTVAAPGANDNATGIAALLELARVLSTRSHRASIMFVAFSAEEVQRQGSRAFVRDYLLPRNIELNLMINMDMIGTPTDGNGAINDKVIRIYSAGPNESASRQAARTAELIVTELAPYMSVTLYDAEDREGRYGDHMSFSEAGYPSIRVVESYDDLSRVHNDRDVIDAVQGAYLGRVTQTVLTLATSLADGPRPPRNIALRDTGNGARTLVWEPIPGAASYVVALRWPNALRYDQRFETTDTSVTWDGFVPERFVGLAIAAKDSSGLMGPLSSEFTIR